MANSAALLHGAGIGLFFNEVKQTNRGFHSLFYLKVTNKL